MSASRERFGEPMKWLVSCKHYAHSGNSVGRTDEEDILDRLAEHECKGFIGIYSTIPSSGLEQKLQRLQNTKGLIFRIYSSEEIERLLLDTAEGFRLAKRFFPKSIENLWPQIISLQSIYKQEDAKWHGPHKWIVTKAFESQDIRVYASSDDLAVTFANENATREMHRPMFLKAWKDAVKMYPDFFHIPAEGVDAVCDTKALAPKWEAEQNLNQKSPMIRWWILAVWSLVNQDKVRTILKSMGRQQDLDLMSYAWLAKNTGTERRDVLVRLFAYCC